MLIIRHVVKSSSQFMDRYLPEGPAGGFFLPEKLGMRGRICLELHLEWLGETYFPLARIEKSGVVWENAGRRLRGAVVRLDAEEAPLRDALLEKVRRFSGGYRDRKADRCPVNLLAHCVTATGAADGELRNLSASGALVRTPTPLPIGTPLQLRFEDPAQQVMWHVRARVARLDFGGAESGMGVQFEFQTRRERRAMSRLCAVLAQGDVPAPRRRFGLPEAVAALLP